MLFLTNYEIQYEVLKKKKKMMVLLTSSRHTWWRGIPQGSGWWCSRSVNLQKGAILWRLNYFYISMLTRGSTLQHLWTRPRRSSCERVVEVESRMSEYEDKRRRIIYSVSDRIPERAWKILILTKKKVENWNEYKNLSSLKSGIFSLNSMLLVSFENKTYNNTIGWIDI